MKKLLIKEFKLTASPLTFLFLLFSAMTMIPGYPILVGAFFQCLSLLYTFQFAREFGDVQYTAMLPVAKSAVVKARFLFVVTIEMMGFSLTALLTILRMVFLSDVAVYLQNPLMNANGVFLGFWLLIFGLFNAIFVRGFFKTAFYFGKVFIYFSVAAFLLIALAETLHHFPGLHWMGAPGFENPLGQLLFLAASAGIYILLTWLALKKSIRSFEKIDL